MKPIEKNIVWGIGIIIMLIALIFELTSCNKVAQKPLPRPFKTIDCANTYGLTVRAKVLENNTITYCRLNMCQQITLHSTDTVWLDLSKHTINDTAENTMLVVLYNDK